RCTGRTVNKTIALTAHFLLFPDPLFPVPYSKNRCTDRTLPTLRYQKTVALAAQLIKPLHWAYSSDTPPCSERAPRGLRPQLPAA
ncbi:MAG: hypothetical protein F6J98_45590, partial [Moorea sp. SIO4G2]|nr:hypothetical protein [Moorena sp. SIO4G2]